MDVLSKYNFLEGCSGHKKEIHLLYGQIQSGKTEALLATCLVTQQTNIPTLFLIPNLSNGWYGQLKPRIYSFNQKYSTSLHAIYVGELKTDELKEKLIQFPNVVLVCLANSAQLGRCADMLEHQPFHMIMDEADQMYKDDETVFSPIFQLLINESKMIFVVSATTFKLWFEAELHTKTTHLLSIPEQYKGLNHFGYQWTNLDKHKYIAIGNGPVKEADHSFSLWMDDLLQEPVFTYKKEKQLVKHPIIGLYKGTDEIKLHSNIQNEIRRDFPSVTTFTYDSKGIILYSPFLQHSSIHIHGGCYKLKHGKYVIENRSVSEILQYLKDNGGAERFPVIVIISGRLANRMFSFVSKDYEWHLTHQRLYMSNSADCTTLLQSVRLCGIYHDDIPLTLSCDIELFNSLRKAFELQQHIIEKLYQEERQMTVEEFVKEGHVEKTQIPKRKLVAGHSYNKQIGTIQQPLLKQSFDSEEDRGLEILFRMITEKKNASPAPAYLRILRCFDEHKEDELDRSVIVREANLVNFSHYTHWNLARHNQYQLLVLNGTKYSIHPKVKIWWEQNM